MPLPVEVDPYTQTVESDSLSLGPGEEVLAVSAVGPFSSAQVYLVGPTAWRSTTIFVRLYGRMGGGRLLLAQEPLQGPRHLIENDVFTALAISVGSVAVEGFEVVLVQTNPGASEVTDGRVLLIASARSDGAQGPAAPQAGRWPVFLSDGTEEVGSTERALHVQKSDRRAAYYSSAAVGTGMSSVTNKSILYVWNDNTSRRVEIRRVTIAYLAGVGGNLTVRGAHITGEASPAGGTSITPLPLDPSDGGSLMTSVAGANAPTRVAADLILFAVPFTATGTFTWSWTDLGKPIVLPAGDWSGFEIRVDVSANAAAEMKLHVSIEWVEV